MNKSIIKDLWPAVVGFLYINPIHNLIRNLIHKQDIITFNKYFYFSF